VFQQGSLNFLHWLAGFLCFSSSSFNQPARTSFHSHHCLPSTISRPSGQCGANTSNSHPFPGYPAPPWDASRCVFAEIMADAPASYIDWKQVDVNPLLTAGLALRQRIAIIHCSPLRFLQCWGWHLFPTCWSCYLHSAPNRPCPSSHRSSSSTLSCSTLTLVLNGCARQSSIHFAYDLDFHRTMGN